MVAANQLTPGLTISYGKNVYRVESCVKVSLPKGASFIKVKVRDLGTGEISEKNFKPTQEVEEVALQESRLEYLYPEDDCFIFLNVNTLDQVSVPDDIIGEKQNYLREGVEVRASSCGLTVLGVDLPQFLELTVSSVEGATGPNKISSGVRLARLETGAVLEVPPFIEPGDVIKVDTQSKEYIQRV